MYSNIAGKLKKLAFVVLIVGIIGSVIGGIIAITAGGVPMFLIVACVGSLASLIGSWVVYAIGELVENSAESRTQSTRNGEALRTANELLRKLVAEQEKNT
ncbi:MAG: hypothetical protein LBN02_01085 [Oscillospiraceae bacterium]|jgi:membrane protein YqaA with SNARE-associated domain|nr:hypothetical protein [Oscillospiraceae bacterium]